MPQQSQKHAMMLVAGLALEPTDDLVSEYWTQAPLAEPCAPDDLAVAIPASGHGGRCRRRARVAQRRCGLGPGSSGQELQGQGKYIHSPHVNSKIEVRDGRDGLTNRA
jgi:hypothetical protein